jgi:uncharacterized protein YbjT (DUF2867 family)
MPTDNIVLVTGATGKQGGALIRHLHGKGHKLRAMTRNPTSDAAKALAAKGVEVVVGDLDDQASLERAVAGAWGVFGVQNTWEAGVEKEEVQGKRLAKVARDEGVQHFVYTSVGSAHRKTGIPHFENKVRVEETVKSLNFPSHAIVRPVFFMENLTSPWFLNGDKLVTAMAPTTSLQMIASDDIGKVAAYLFERASEVNGWEIDIAGDAMTMPQAAAVLGEALHKKLEFLPIPIGEVRKNSEDFALMLEWFDRVGYNADIDGVQKKLGIKFMKLAEWARQQR